MSFTRKHFYEGITYHEADWDELQTNIANYYDALLATMQGQIDGILADYLTSAHRTEGDPHPLIDMDYIKQGSAYKKLTTTQANQLNIIWAAFGGPPSMDNIPQGSAYKKLSSAEYAKFLTGFYDILDQGSTIKFGHGRSIDSFYFAKDGDSDGANIYANDLFSRGNPVYTIVYTSPWHQLTSSTNTGLVAHGLGYRPSFGMLQVCITDPTGQPEEYIHTESYAHGYLLPYYDSYARWNNANYTIFNHSPYTFCFRILLFAYLGS